MSTLIFLGVGIIALFVLYVLVIGGRAYLKYRGARVVTCPETRAPAGVTVNARLAAFGAATGTTELRLKECSRWPERQGCGQECLREIQLAPEDCLVRNIVAKWYAGKSCALCGTPFGPIRSWDHTPGLIRSGGEAVACSEVPAEHLADVLAAHRPICWNCLIAEDFRRRNPDLVIQRPAAGPPRGNRH